jgi:hypothetical protein
VRDSDSGHAYGFVELFESFRAPVRGGHDYFVESPPSSLSLGPAQLRALEVRAPFFIDRGWSASPNQELVPFVWDPASGGQPRFSEAEAFTDYDSGHFGLAAVSAPTGAAQAQLYAVLAQAIVDVHRANRSLMSEWFEAQGTGSQRIFVYFDEERFTPEEKLLAPDGTIDQALWDARLQELAEHLERQAFLRHHIRWVEFLAHAVDVPELMGTIKAAQSTP